MSKGLVSDKVLDDISLFRAGLFELAAKNAEGLSGPEVIRLLKEVSEDVYEAGIDRKLAKSGISNLDHLADAFDFTWLSVFLVRVGDRERK